VQPLLLWISNDYYTGCVCVYGAFGIQHAMRMRHPVICGLPVLQYFSHLIDGTISGRRRRGGGEVIEHKMYILIFLQLLPETFLIRKRI
jgi:hypothetical protein